jgi:DNA-binding CsgD family transcriptional regulator
MTPDSTGTDHSGITAVEFELSDSAYPFVGLSEEEECRVILEKMLPRGEGNYAEFFSVLGAEPDSVLDIAEENDLVEPNLIDRYDNGGLFEFVVEGFCPARDLAERGAVPQEVVGEDGRGRIRAEVPSTVDTSSTIHGFLKDHPTAELRVKETKDSLAPVFTQSELQKAVDERLTDRQQEVLQVAYDHGYYDASSDTTGEKVAEMMDLSSPTISQHLRAAERKLISILMEANLTGR